MYLKAYSCRAYIIILDAQLKKKRLNKLDPRAHIGYLISYNFTNIYKIWILYKGIVIFTKDIIFNKKTFFNGKQIDIIKDLYAKLDTLIKKIQLPDIQIKNKVLLENDKEVFKLLIQEEDHNNKNKPV